MVFALCAGSGYGEWEIASTTVLAVYEKPLETSCFCMHPEHTLIDVLFLSGLFPVFFRHLAILIKDN